ncbi:Ca2+-modulated nonselective cation channel polycystin [Klebsormidium nitens]|uniref:Ca2+-modulated nonselective cation channel polycystin n=1 Tax=Klebsormidium nitens TaxID=105231 RepID=A0A1Y1HUY1_KLENI|nr:Ca2+-modulated nonselective cation channel polycystin [Klebsormidium nitens]|eukprot:GAQ79658.1 Ca2+-modulated nonselective cation channel polycystin [Klebsormidium nitens]
MAVQIILNKRRKAKEAEELGKKPQKVAFNNPAFQPSQAKAKERKQKARFADAPDGATYGKVGLEDGMSVVNEHDRTVVRRLYETVKETKSRKTDYCNLFAFLIFTALYCTVLYLQFNVAELYKLVTSQQALLPGDGGDRVTTFGNANDVYDYINNTFIQTVWADPICGDGVCDRPVEFSGFGRFGCSIDCGDMDTEDVSFQFTTTFGSPDDLAISDWNVCEIEPDRLCWFETNQPFQAQTGFFETTLALPNGTWELRITAPNGGVSGAATISVSGASTEKYVQETLTRFGSCVPEDQSALTLCRRQCAVNAKCIVDACSSIPAERLTDVLVDCFTLCNSNFTSMQPYTNLNCVQVGQLANSSDDTVSFLATTGRKCILNPAYLAANPSQAASLARGTPAPTGGQLNTSGLTVTAVPPGRRRLSQLADNPYLPANGNATTLYWNQFGTTDQQRYSNLATAIARSIDTWTADSCITKYTISSSRQGPRMLGFFCAYFGGPATFPGCGILDPTTNTTLDSSNPAALQAFLARRYGPGNTGNYSISAQEQDTFIAILLNALDSVIATGLSESNYLATEDLLHATDTAVVVDPGNNCNRPNVALEWKLNVHYSTNVSVGDSIQFIWADDLPHALRGEGLDDLQDVFRGVGANRRFVARGTVCTPQNIGDLENGSFTGDPTPCVLGRTRGGNSDAGGTFTSTTLFRNPGIYAYRDAKYGNLMTGTVYVSRGSGTAPSSATLPQEDLECSPGCPIRLLNNGRCDASFNCLTSECSFDGGDCSCPDPANIISSANTVSINSDAFCQCPAGQTKGPNAACCQAEFIGVNKKYPFNVIIQSSSEGVGAIANYDRERFATNHNRVLGGLLIHQTRYRGSPCTSKRFLNLFQSCGSGTSTEPYGVDPVFVPASPLYNIDVQPRVSQFYAPDEQNLRGTPRGFFPAEVAGLSSGFPIVIDVDLDQGGASDRLQYLVDGLFLDNATETLTLRLPTYNGFDNMFIFFELRMAFLTAGKISIKQSTFAIDLQAYLTPKSYARAALEILLTFGILFATYSEIKDMVAIKRKTGSFLRHFNSFWNYIDAISIALLLTALVMRIIFIFGLTPGFKAQVSYDIYEDLNAEARFFQLKTDGSELGDFAYMLNRLKALTTYRAAYISINGINIFFMILRLLKLLDFQPRMGVLTRTLAEAGPDLLNFFVLWGLIFIGYSFMGHIIVGSSVEYFRTLGFSMATCFAIILGDTQAQSNFLALDGWQFWASQLFFWSFNIFMVMVVMNFLVAIAVDAFADVKERTETAPTIVEEVVEFGKYEIERPFKRQLSDAKVMKQLKAWGAKKRKVVEDGNRSKGSDFESTGEDGELSERLVLTLDGRQLDLDALQEIFERRRMEADDVGSHDPQRLARQILAMYGKHVTERASKSKKPVKKNKELHEVKSGMSKMERRLIDSEARIEGMCTTVIGALVKSGMLSETDLYNAEAQGSPEDMDGDDDTGTED